MKKWTVVALDPAFGTIRPVLDYSTSLDRIYNTEQGAKDHAVRAQKYNKDVVYLVMEIDDE